MMGKSTENQEASKAARRTILDGIIDMSLEPKVSFYTTTGVRFDTRRSYIEFADEMANDDPFITVETFTWDGERGSKPKLFITSIRKDTITEFSEVSDELWTQFVTSAADRATQAKMMPGSLGASIN